MATATAIWRTTDAGRWVGLYVCWCRVEWVGSWLVRRWMHRGGAIGSEARGKATGRIQPHQSILRVQGHRPTNYPRLIDTRDKRKKIVPTLSFLYFLCDNDYVSILVECFQKSRHSKTRYDVARNIRIRFRLIPIQVEAKLDKCLIYSKFRDNTEQI